MKNIREIRTLPISELTDEEIVKATMDRLKAKCVMLVYEDSENGIAFLGRYRKGGSLLLNQLKKAWEEKWGKLTKIEEEEK
ncbi:hypothetical protein G7050_02760 [Dysgonomonas sp. HDW5A]|uniref:hypothetical protein n=1 Tax=Dysgonomonas sp. HDW5A TaxID=2714926 RepID=UPI00140B1981|nr:hypothetical protein [Dysgonomonas sp. HDW5A]QIK58820.1 hypothetical protein G7050_02760 [Dysgonomonas sp. HDW5A]